MTAIITNSHHRTAYAKVGVYNAAGVNRGRRGRTLWEGWLPPASRTTVELAAPAGTRLAVLSKPRNVVTVTAADSGRAA